MNETKTANANSLTELFGEVISSYSRADALADGDLVDVTRQASSAEMMGGFNLSTAVTRALWAAIEAVPASLAGIADVRGRLHDVLWMAGCAARRNRGGSAANFVVILPSKGTRKRNVYLVVTLSGGDDGEPVVTIGYPSDF